MRKLLLTTALLGSLAIADVVWAAGEDKTLMLDGHFMPFADVLAKFPAADAAMIQDSFKAARTNNHELTEHMRRLRIERQAIIAANKFDSDAYLAKCAAIIQLDDQMRTAYDKNFADVLSKLPPEERRQLADAMANFRPRPPVPAAANPAAPGAPDATKKP